MSPQKDPKFIASEIQGLVPIFSFYHAQIVSVKFIRKKQIERIKNQSNQERKRSNIKILVLCILPMQMHAWRMRSHGRNWWITLKNHRKVLCKAHEEFSSWASRTHDGKGTFFMIFKCFSLFSNMQTHAQACVHWSKYTTSWPNFPTLVCSLEMNK